ncbi:MAG TPA: pyridoxal phosphate-dependent aminotransferase [Terriglobia bacterium]|nr:pyridoxal phosphate-dependent aminotransferase [Terriglobia bacterium]
MFAHRTEWPLDPNALSRAISYRREHGLPLLDLTESNPTRCGFEYDSAAILRALAKPAALTYQPESRGPLGAREAVANYYGEGGVHVDPGQIFLTASTSEAYSYLFRLLADPGDGVLVPRPSYPLFDFLAGLNDLEIAPYALTYRDKWRIDLDDLASRVGCDDHVLHLPRALVVVHPNNPTGSFVHANERDTLIKICHHNRLALIADEVFADYALPGNSTYDRSVASGATGGPDKRTASSHAGLDDILTFTLSGLSKISALPHMKLAWIVVSGPAEERRAAIERLEIIADTYLSVSTPVAAALPELLETRWAIQPQIIGRLKQNLAELDRQLSAASCVTRLEVEGGWYVILRIPLARSEGSLVGQESGGRCEPSEDDFTAQLARGEGVLVHPGHFYEFASEDYAVLSLITPTQVFADGLQKLCRWVNA